MAMAITLGGDTQLPRVPPTVAQVTRVDAENIPVTVVTAPEPIALPQSDHGAARLAVLGRVKWAGTIGLLRRLGLGTGMHCLDVGCGSGSVTLAMARMVGPTGHVVGFDRNKTVLRWAVDAAKRQSVGQATFCTADVHDLQLEIREPTGAVTVRTVSVPAGGSAVLS